MLHEDGQTVHTRVLWGSVSHRDASPEPLSVWIETSSEPTGCVREEEYLGWKTLAWGRPDLLEGSWGHGRGADEVQEEGSHRTADNGRTLHFILGVRRHLFDLPVSFNAQFKSLRPTQRQKREGRQGGRERRNS